MNPHRKKKKICSVHTSLLVILSFPMSIRPLQPNLALPIAPMVRSLSKLFKDQTACSDNGVPCKVNASKPLTPPSQIIALQAIHHLWMGHAPPLLGFLLQAKVAPLIGLCNKTDLWTG